jgi:starch synthase
MRVAILSPEVVPFAKTGGLADVAGALPKALVQREIDAAVVLPIRLIARSLNPIRSMT